MPPADFEALYKAKQADLPALMRKARPRPEAGPWLQPNGPAAICTPPPSLLLPLPMSLLCTPSPCPRVKQTRRRRAAICTPPPY